MMASRSGPLYMLHGMNKRQEKQSGLEHLLAAAVVNRQFCKLLLEYPEIALKNGYLGEMFELSREERDRVTSACAHSLADLAKTLTSSQGWK